ncbi:hypothetical protein A3731_22355 [Roseovarius sp. HI0049]|nr:hypothetical protein A3731_22355 [Roseovarius sp. HI0049]
MPKLTLKRAHSKDPIRVNVWVFSPATLKGVQTEGLFDTGNDHTTVSKQLLDSIGVPCTGRSLTVSGITGASVGQAAIVNLGFDLDWGDKVEIEGHEVAVVAGASSHVLFGRDFLEWFDITMKRGGRFTLER